MSLVAVQIKEGVSPGEYIYALLVIPVVVVIINLLLLLYLSLCR